VNNCFAVAAALNARCMGKSEGPFWGCHKGIQEACLKSTGSSYPYLTGSGISLEEKRETERRLSGVQPTWKLWGNGTVGSQALLGIPVVARLRDDPELKDISRVWPFETRFGLDSVAAGRPFILHAEIWPGVVNALLDPSIPIKDQRQVRAMVDWLAMLDAGDRLMPWFGRPVGLFDDGEKRVVEEEGGFSAPVASVIAGSHSRVEHLAAAQLSRWSAYAIRNALGQTEAVGD
jgi:precorrin-8X/cobalt-precorrin-8 methylmutase